MLLVFACFQFMLTFNVDTATKGQWRVFSTDNEQGAYVREWQ